MLPQYAPIAQHLRPFPMHPQACSSQRPSYRLVPGGHTVVLLRCRVCCMNKMPRQMCLRALCLPVCSAHRERWVSGDLAVSTYKFICEHAPLLTQEITIDCRKQEQCVVDQWYCCTEANRSDNGQSDGQSGFNTRPKRGGCGLKWWKGMQI